MNTWIPIIAAAIGGIFAQPFISKIFAYKRKKLKNLLKVVENKSLFDEVPKDFKEGFILPDFEENYFYVQTGIRTNYKSIEKYISLKNTLGEDFTWDIIKQAKPHIEFKDSQLRVSISKGKRLKKEIALQFASLCIVFSLFLVIYLLSQYELKGFRGLFQLVSIMVISLFVGYVIAISIQPLISATMIEKKLNKLNTDKLPPTAN